MKPKLKKLKNRAQQVGLLLSACIGASVQATEQSPMVLTEAADGVREVAGAVAAPSADIRRNLTQFIEEAEKNGHELDEAKGRIEFAQARTDLARSYGLPSGKIDLYFGPVPGARGDALMGQTDWNQWGVFSVTKFEITQPIYTFGAISAGKDAAQAGVRAEQSLAERSRLQLRTSLAEIYYGYQLAFELSELTSDIGSKLEEALKTGTKNRDERKRGAPSSIELDKLKVFISDIRVKEQEALKAQKLARAAMSWKLGVYGEREAKWDRANLLVRSFKLTGLDQLQTIARANRPEYKALAEDVKARESMVKVEEALTLPMVYVAGQFNYTVSTKRADQTSPFAYDPLNDLSGAALLGLRWNLGFERRSKLSMANAELIQARARLAHLGAAIAVDVERSYLDAKLVIDAMEQRLEGARASKRVFNDSFVAFTLGTGSAKDLLEALGIYGVAEKNRLDAIFQNNVAVFKLQQAIGAELPD
jgi:outer membrane protein TolC